MLIYFQPVLGCMGVKLADLVAGTEIELKDLNGRVIVIDSFNILYQFLASIRQRDGTLLLDSKGRVTSHLTGLFSRTSRLLQHGVKPIFVFDGKTPDLKLEEQKRRRLLKEEAVDKYETAKEKGDVDGMRKFASRTSRLTPEMVDEAKQLITALGLPIVQAPSEGEAQASAMVSKGDAYAVASEDFDSLLFGAPRMLRRLNVTGRRRIANTLSTKAVMPELVTLDSMLSSLGLTREQLIALGLLVGTDYNPGGVKGIGPKKGLKLVQKFGTDFEKMFASVDWDSHCSHPWKQVYSLFTDMPVTEEYNLAFSPVDVDAVYKVLVEEHDFSTARVDSTLEKLNAKTDKSQKGLGEWF